MWAGRGPYSGRKPILIATTLAKYLCGLCAWHVFHDLKYPALLDKKTALLLKSSAKLDAKEVARFQKGAIMIADLLQLAGVLSNGSNQDLATLDTELVAFWGCARLSELTYKPGYLAGGGGAGLLHRDVVWGPGNGWARITLREAKTASPGELQFIRVDQIPNCLCPVAALERLVKSCQDPTSTLSGFQVQHSQTPLSKYMMTA
jgi:hypothetical protein